MGYIPRKLERLLDSKSDRQCHPRWLFAWSYV